MTTTNNLFSVMTSMTEASPETITIRTPMTKDQVTELKAKLKDEYRNNVYPNQFDVNKPYRVSIRFNQQITNHGSFSDIDAASMIGTIVSMARFGKKALKGNFDADKAQDSLELQEWMKDERNQEIITMANKAYL